VGFVGLGNMGLPMARNLLDAGCSLIVNDLRETAAGPLVDKGATWSALPRDVAASSDVTFISLPGPDAVESVTHGPDGLMAGATAGHIIVDTSTSTPASIRAIAAAAAQRDVHVLDAPLSGGMRGARKATLTIMVGGEPEQFNKCLPLLRVLGTHVLHMGPVGSGHVTKLVNNFMGLSNALASMEAMVMGVAAGIEPTRLLEAVNLGTGSSHMTRTLYPYIVLPRRFDPVRFSMALAVKDVQLALELANEVGLSLRLGPAVHAAYQAALAEGLVNVDFSAYIRLLEDQVGVEVRADDRESE
jgi:3-hydroxyisobutyrate dehydrogenase-like beta-hydroxyacid dehydrogenase